MTRKKPTNIPVSVRNRLLTLARERGEDFQFVLIRYALERLLYRLSQSPHRDSFTLKGAMLFRLWSNDQHRHTKDLDLLGSGKVDVARIEQVFREVCQVPYADDGILFKHDSVRAEKRREDELYEGLHVELEAELAGSRIYVQIDVGFGDAITPGPIVSAYPTLLELAAPILRTYPRETVVAEKFQAMVSLGMTNSRLKDFFDLWVLARKFDFAGQNLCDALQATFKRRETLLPVGTPLALTPAFYDDVTRARNWQAFLKRSMADVSTPAFPEVVKALCPFLLPLVEAVKIGESVRQDWPAGGPWRTSV